MTRPRTHVDYLHDMLDAVRNGQAFVQEITFEAFANDTKTVYAVIRVLEIIGEANKSIPPHIRDRDPSIPWYLMAACLLWHTPRSCVENGDRRFASFGASHSAITT